MRRRRLAFPNHNLHFGGCGAYGLHRTAIGHRLAVRRVSYALRHIENEFDAIYVTGQSGIVPGSVVAWCLKKPLVILRKDEECSHGQRIEGGDDNCANMRLVIVDDFVSRAGTMERLLSHPSIGRVVAVCLYGQPRTNKEIEAGYAKTWATTRYMNEWLRLVRRGPRSLLFDVVREAGWAPPSQP